MGRFRDFLERFTDREVISLVQSISAEDSTKLYGLALKDFAIQMGINLISGIIAKCEFKVMMNGKESKRDEYYLWNFEPNKNQNATAFMTELVSKLVFNNEVLCVPANDQLIIADSFDRQKYAVLPNIYKDVQRGDFRFNRTFSESDVIYLRYANANMSGLLSELVNQYAEVLSGILTKYQKAGGRHVVINSEALPKASEDMKKVMNDLYTNRFKSYFKDADALIVIPKGLNYNEYGTGTSVGTADIVSMTKEVFASVARALRIPPAILIGDVANLDNAIDEMLTTSILPLVDQLETEINRKRFGKQGFFSGCEIKIDTTAIKHFELLEIATGADKIIASGILSVDEIRARVGELPLNTWWSKRHWMTKNYAELSELGKELTDEDSENSDDATGSAE